MSSPNKEETKVPNFDPLIDKDILRDREPVLTNLLGVNHKARVDARSYPGISSPQFKNAKDAKDARANSRDYSGIG